MEDIYVDDLITGGDKIMDVQTLKDIAVQIFKEAGFVLHKWHSNAKQQLCKTATECQIWGDKNVRNQVG